MKKIQITQRHCEQSEAICL